MTHVRITTKDHSVDTGSVRLPFVPNVGELVAWEMGGGSVRWFRVVERLFYAFEGLPSATLIVEPAKESA